MGGRQRKKQVLENLIKNEDIKNAFIFCNRKKDVGELARLLEKKGYDAAPIHGDMPQSARTAVLKRFKNDELKFLVCSDVVARGIDIAGVSHVFNYDVPMNADDYVHRIGRTGRAGQQGRAWMIAAKKKTINSLMRSRRPSRKAYRSKRLVRPAVVPMEKRRGRLRSS